MVGSNFRQGTRQLRQEVEHWQGAHALAASEVQSRLEEAERAATAAAAAQAENAELVRRLVEVGRRGCACGCYALPVHT